jgi:hypothetical protein
MGISTESEVTTASGVLLPAFSEHILKIEKLGPDVSIKYLQTATRSGPLMNLRKNILL